MECDLYSFVKKMCTMNLVLAKMKRMTKEMMLDRLAVLKSPIATCFMQFGEEMRMKMEEGNPAETCGGRR